MEHENIVTESAKENAARLSIIQADLNKELEKFPSKTLGLKMLSEKMKISDRTIRRILNGTHAPSFQTAIKVYRYLTGSLNDRETIMKMPETVRASVTANYANFSLQSEDKKFLPEIDFYIENDSVFRSIYVETCAGAISRDKVGFDHGQHGLRILDQMVKLDVIKEVEPNIYESSVNRAQLGPKCSTEIMKFLIEHKFQAEKLNVRGENFGQFFIEGIDVESYNKFLEIEWNANAEKLKIIKNSKKGPVKFWSVVLVDTLSKSMIYDDNESSDDRGVLQ